ncbi:MAG: hypothetical protein WC401_12900 [Bacteroidales bacterium]|jgi:hypothetical protein|nr:hypothetical protein [Bacteroidales bacterium]
MKASSLKELKTELETLSQRQIIDVCMRLVKYKKENKELLTYLLFQAGDEQAYINEVKEHINEQFEGVNKSNLYLSKKMLRKILRTSNKFIRYSGSKQTEVELRIFFCKKLKSSGIPLHTNKALDNLYQRQIQKINTALASLHEDLQYDYSVELKELY